MCQFIVDFSIWTGVTKSQPVLTQNSIGKSAHKENVSLFNNVNNLSNFAGEHFGEHLRLRSFSMGLMAM